MDATTIGARFDERYGKPGYHYGLEPNEFLVSQAALLAPGQRALVPGDGEGRNGVWLAQQGLDVTTFDPSPVGVRKSKELAAERGVTLDAHVGDFASWDWKPDSYDAVILTYVHCGPEVRAAGHAAVWRSLRPGGVVILEAFSPRQVAMREQGASGGPKNAEWLFSEDMMRADFPTAEFLLLEDVDVDFEGRTHGGHCAVLRVVARKPAG